MASQNSEMEMPSEEADAVAADAAAEATPDAAPAAEAASHAAAVEADAETAAAEAAAAETAAAEAAADAAAEAVADAAAEVAAAEAAAEAAADAAAKAAAFPDAAAADAPSSTSLNPLQVRLQAHKRVQQENMSHMEKIVDILERARNNLKELERQRVAHLEGLKKLRARLFQENEELRLTAAEMSGSSVPEATLATTSRDLPGSSKAITGTQTVDTTAISSCPRQKTSSNSLKIVKIPSKNLSLANSEAPPAPPLPPGQQPRAASSSRSLNPKRSQQSQKRSKHRMLPSSNNQNSVEALNEESEQSSTAKHLKQRLLSNFKYLN